MEESTQYVSGNVGIFWFFKGTVIQDSVPIVQGEDYGDFVNGNSDHCTYWPGIQRCMPEATIYEYDQVPRGRVVYNKKTDTFYVYGSEKFIQNMSQRELIQAEFKLPLDKTVFKADEHYSSIPGMLEE